MPQHGNLVHETSTTTGTGDITLTSVLGKRTFTSAFGINGGGLNELFYFISNRGAAEWEVGTGTITASATLTRDTVLASSNANALVNFSSGTKDVTNDIPAGFQSSITAADAPPSNPSIDDIWIRTTNFAPFVYYDDGNSTQWVQFGTAAAGGNIPANNDGAALGEADTAWSDLFLADGGVINWGNGLAALRNLTDFGALGFGETLELDFGASAYPALTAKTTSTGGFSIISYTTFNGTSEPFTIYPYFQTSTAAQHGAGSFHCDVTSNTNAAEETRWRMRWLDAGAYREVQFIDSTIRPVTDDTLALGTSTVSWSDLFLASGGVINWNAGNVTLTHAPGELQLVGNLVPGATDTYDLGAPGDNWQQIFLSNTGEIRWNNGSHVIEQEVQWLSFYIDQNNTVANSGIRINIDGTNTYQFLSGALSPMANDLAALGTNSLSWSDLYLADGGVINWGDGDCSIVHNATFGLLSLRADTANAVASSQINFQVDGENQVTIIDGFLYPTTNDIVSLGSTVFGWSDLYLASGGVVGWDGGDVTLTHGSDKLNLNFATGTYPAFEIYHTNTAQFEGPSINIKKNNSSGTVDFEFIGAINFMTQDSASNFDEYARIQVWTEDVTSTTEDGYLSIAAMVGGTVTECARFSNGGVSFDSGSNFLDDYEEGTWTPGLWFNGVNITSTSGSYDAQNGTYTKIGNVVHVWGRIDVASIGTATGSAQISTLPFNTTSSTNYRTIGSLNIDNLNVPANYAGLHMESQTSDGRLDLAYYDSSTGDGTFLTDSEFSGDEFIEFQCTYMTDS